MIDNYNSIIKTEEEDFEEYLRKIHLIDIFKSILEEFPDKELFKGIVQFIAWGFSMESDMLATQGNTWGIVCKNIYERTELPDDEDTFDLVANLKSDGVRLAIERWLQLQNSEGWTQYIHYRDLRKQMLAASLDTLKKASGEVDYTAKMDCAKFSKELLTMMDDAKENFIQNHPKLKGSTEVLNRVNKERNSRSVGNYAVN